MRTLERALRGLSSSGLGMFTRAGHSRNPAVGRTTVDRISRKHDPRGDESAMDPLTHPTVRRVLERARRDPDVLAVMLFGSHARGEASAASDVDLCLVLASETLTNLEMS